MKSFYLRPLRCWRFAPALKQQALSCNADRPRCWYGADDGDTNPVVVTAVSHSWDDHSWRVFHQLRSGAIVSRQAQYGMTDTSTDNRRTQWQGRLLRQPWLFMVGEIKMNKQTESCLSRVDVRRQARQCAGDAVHDDLHQTPAACTTTAGADYKAGVAADPAAAAAASDGQDT